MPCPRQLKTKLLVNGIKRKIKEKIRKILRKKIFFHRILGNVNSRKCYNNSYITIYIKKMPSPYSHAPDLLKFQERPALWNYRSSKFICAPPNFREGAHTMYPCSHHAHTLYTFQKTRIGIFFW